MKIHQPENPASIASPRAKHIKIASHAKLNLFLDVLNKRIDGYHNILTLFERISLSDYITLTEINSDEIIISSRNKDIPCDEANLAYRAADLIKRSQGVLRGIKIEIEKNIPVGAGLGGGSSNAASVLLGLNHLFRLKLNRKTLIAYANQLGSDVAFFILNTRFAVGTDKGGDLKIAPVPDNIKLWHLLFVPEVKVMTRDIYGLFDKEENALKKAKKRGKSLKLTKKTYDVNILLSHLKRRDIFLLNQNIYNRLSVTVMKSNRLVSALKTDLLKLGLGSVHMSGSGPALFSVFRDKRGAQRVLKKLRDRLSDRCSIFLVSTL